MKTCCEALFPLKKALARHSRHLVCERLPLEFLNLLDMESGNVCIIIGFGLQEGVCIEFRRGVFVCFFRQSGYLVSKVHLKNWAGHQCDRASKAPLCCTPKLTLCILSWGAVPLHGCVAGSAHVRRTCPLEPAKRVAMATAYRQNKSDYNNNDNNERISRANSMRKMLNCAEQVQIQKYKTHSCKTSKRAGV